MGSTHPVNQMAGLRTRLNPLFDGANELAGVSTKGNSTFLLFPAQIAARTQALV